MNLKKIFSFLAIGVLSGALFTGCGDNDNQTDNIRVGRISTLNASEQKVDEVLKTVAKKLMSKL